MSQSKGDRKYWSYSILPIIAFSIISGLRFGRDIDYNNYYFIFTYPDSAEQQEILFQFLIEIFKTLDIPYYLFVQFCSTFLIFSFILLLKDFRESAKYALPLFLLTEGIENMIRWYLGISFLLIALHFFLNRKHYKSVIFSTLGCMCHIGVILLPFMFLIIHKIGNKKTINPYIILLLFFATLFFSNNDILITFATYIQTLEVLSGRASAYMDIIAAEEDRLIFFEQSITTNLRNFIGYSFLILIGSKYVFNNGYQWLYNLSCLAIVLAPILNLIELFNRYSSSLSILSTIAISLVWAKVFTHKKEERIKKMIVLYGVISFFFLIYPYFTDALLKQNIHEVLFIWDANGQKFLNY